MKIYFSQHILEKYSNTKFHENPFGLSPVVRCGRTDGQTGIYYKFSSQFSQFYENAQKMWPIFDAV